MCSDPGTFVVVSEELHFRGKGLYFQLRPGIQYVSKLLHEGDGADHLEVLPYS